MPASDFVGTLGVAHGGTGTSTAFTQGSVVFAGASGTYAQGNSNFFWDATNHRLGIGTTNPQAALDATVNVNGRIANFVDANTGTSSLGVFAQAYGAVEGVSNTAGGWRMLGLGQNATTEGLLAYTNTYGVYGTSTNSIGIEGVSAQTSGEAIYGTTAATTSAVAIYGVTSASTSYGGEFYNSNTGYYCTIGGPSYSISCNGPTSLPSDERLKKDIHPLDTKEGLDAIMALKPVHYLWKDERKNKVHPEGEIGFIAQNVEKVLPILVSEIDQPKEHPAPGPDGKLVAAKNPNPSGVEGKIKALQYDRLITPAVLAIQQLKAQSDSLKAQSDSLKAANDSLKVANDSLKAANDNEASEIKELRKRLDALEAARR